jgi:hypothetical protein
LTRRRVRPRPLLPPPPPPLLLLLLLLVLLLVVVRARACAWVSPLPAPLVPEMPVISAGA